MSTDDQNSALPLAALKRAGCEKVFTDEGLSGATTQRPALHRCLKTLKTGDTLTVWKLDRLARSVRDLIAMLDDFRDRGITGVGVGPTPFPWSDGGLGYKLLRRAAIMHRRAADHMLARRNHTHRSVRRPHCQSAVRCDASETTMTDVHQPLPADKSHYQP